MQTEKRISEEPGASNALVDGKSAANEAEVAIAAAATSTRGEAGGKRLQKRRKLCVGLALAVLFGCVLRKIPRLTHCALCSRTRRAAASEEDADEDADDEAEDLAASTDDENSQCRPEGTAAPAMVDNEDDDDDDDDDDLDLALDDDFGAPVLHKKPCVACLRR